ncbi:MAG: exodeoxyribonuclease VII small subunit [Epsilonproteobacteria bacterium]|nr:exodeoxyribonuclease VII small subunit [Campylobacterota bacterium]
MSKSFEERLKEAKEILERLNSSEITLEEAIELYKKGLETIKEAQTILEDAKLKVIEIDKEESGIKS